MSEMQNHCVLATEDFLCAFWWGGPGNSQRKKTQRQTARDLAHVFNNFFPPESPPQKKRCPTRRRPEPAVFQQAFLLLKHSLNHENLWVLESNVLGRRVLPPKAGEFGCMRKDPATVKPAFGSKTSIKPHRPLWAIAAVQKTHIQGPRLP